MNLHARSILMTIASTLIIAACATGPRPYEELRARDLLAPTHATSDPDWTEVISRKQVREDVDLLVYALERGYAGQSVLPSVPYLKMLDDLGRLRGPLTVNVLMDAIDTILLAVPDSYLWAHRDGKVTELRQRSLKSGRVGPNHLQGGNGVWSAETATWGRKKVLLVSISKSPPADDPAWNGFLESVGALRSGTDAMVVDLRGNPGGDETMGIRFIASLASEKYRHPVAAREDRVTPEALVLERNSVALRIARLRKRGEPVPAALEARLAEKQAAYEAALSAEQPGSLQRGVVRSESPYDSKSSGTQPYAKPIYVIYDGACASTCETWVAGLAALPQARKIGEPSGGYLHFANLGTLRLPHSGILVTIPTRALIYRDGGFNEKIGITPDLPVAAGEDALLALKSRLAKGGRLK